MARTTSIWIVKDSDGKLGAFTVQHELETWLTKLPEGKHVEILKVRDGHPEAGMVILNPRTMKPAI